MTKREKIILALTGMVVVVGLGSLFTGGSAPKQAPQQAQVNALFSRVDGLVKTAQAALPTAHDLGMQAAVATPWPAGGLYEQSLMPKGPAVKPATLPKYTGYVELGSGRLAVVDGIEYQAGDTLEGGGYKVLSITPEKLFLESLANGNRVEVPYEGQDAQDQ